MFESDDSDDDPTVTPDGGLSYWMFPNDGGKNDSAAANLTHGIRLLVHPNAAYELSFDVDSSYSAPKLQLFHVYFNEDSTRYGVTRVRSLKPTEENGRYVYRFTCEENAAAIWATSLSDGSSFYKGTSNNIKFTGEGAYSDHLSLNFIVVGKVLNTTDSVAPEGIAEKILEGFRKYYTSITIDTLYIRHAEDHPTLGYKYPANEPWLAGKSSSDMFLSELGGWPEKGVTNALDIVYMHRIESVGVMGYASLFSMNLGGGSESTVIIGNRVLDVTGQELALESDEIVLSALHESGHFFGLRHTTSTQSDFEVTEDYSMYEDGFDDTPYCKALLQSGLYKPSAGNSLMNTDGLSSDGIVDYAVPGPKIFKRVTKAAAGILFNEDDCPDASNYMFPSDVDVETTGFSAQQLEVIRKNLMVMPH